MIIKDIEYKLKDGRNALIRSPRDEDIQGIGTRFFQELIQIAEENKNIIQMELEFAEGNSRVRALYEKMNFAGCLALEQAKQCVVNERENKVRRNVKPGTTTNPQYRK